MAPPTDLGDGPLCPEPGMHGKTYTSKETGRLWCPVTQTMYAPAVYSEEAKGFVVGPLVRQGEVPVPKKTVALPTSDDSLPEEA